MRFNASNLLLKSTEFSIAQLVRRWAALGKPQDEAKKS
ncbi:hypothetical protein PC116_g27602 [Phytophthora cactorum]|uniref:Uncharacterized protein n=1 Tax=Phytophthora cactorum TaxID=29920 RepID=A0A8T1APQ2_9STRA|nr:hypothetical protein PC114_g25995 [Phytophthora cactorum]KAG2884491.1 hypothetical protein PC117_g25817 [Phytophthora cactorum]KAG2963204.1 hypothetical protein PC119_g25582 [Phytophthora cactorum]KAG2977533.1 hypothetical protein PC120_g25484 [Phytophthora cactorum]KAG3125002.1 hypothetical protein C6341_g25954 [Phytophthora cactorum]